MAELLPAPPGTCNHRRESDTKEGEQRGEPQFRKELWQIGASQDPTDLWNLAHHRDLQDLGIIYTSLKMAKDRVGLEEKDTSIIKTLIKETLLTLNGLTIDYIEITDIKNLSTLEIINQSVLISLAVYFKNVRLIDNIEVVV